MQQHNFKQSQAITPAPYSGSQRVLAIMQCIKPSHSLYSQGTATLAVLSALTMPDTLAEEVLAALIKALLVLSRCSSSTRPPECTCLNQLSTPPFEHQHGCKPTTRAAPCRAVNQLKHQQQHCAGKGLQASKSGHSSRLSSSNAGKAQQHRGSDSVFLQLRTARAASRAADESPPCPAAVGTVIEDWDLTASTP